MSREPGEYKDLRKKRGATGEQLAAERLETEGYLVLDRNWRCKLGELDIVADDSGAIVFVEVRTRRQTGTFGTSKESVDARKIAQVRRTALAYLHQKGKHTSRVRFDVIAIELDAATEEVLHFEHVRNAF